MKKLRIYVDMDGVISDFDKASKHPPVGSKKGRPDLYNDSMVHYVTDDQFAYAAGVNGIMNREKPAACLYMGKFYAESLLLAETGNSVSYTHLTLPTKAEV